MADVDVSFAVCQMTNKGCYYYYYCYYYYDQPPFTDIIRNNRLKFFGDIARSDPSMDHRQVLRASLAPPPRDWNRRGATCRLGRLNSAIFDQHFAISQKRYKTWIRMDEVTIKD